MLQFWRGAGQALAVMAGFVVLGLGAAQALQPESAGEESAYSGAVMSENPDRPVWLVDGFNVLHAVVLKGRDRAKWWSAPARAKVVALAESMASDDIDLWVVFDGDDDPEADDSCSAVQQAFAPSADDWMVKRVKELGECDVTVVTSDRQLSERVRHHGAKVIRPHEFQRRCVDAERARRETS